MVLALLGPLEVEFLINHSLIRFVVKPPYLFRASTFKASFIYKTREISILGKRGKIVISIT